MTDSPTNEAQNSEPQTEPQQPQIPNTINEVSPEQWQAFVGALTEQNNALQAAVQQRDGALREITAKERREQLSQMSDKERADMYEAQLNQIQQLGSQAQAQDVSNTVWQRRDADAAARILQSHGLNGNEPELYRAAWDVNWMPRFAASVDALVKSRGTNGRGRNGANAAENPANRANVGAGAPVPEIDVNSTSGFDVIRFALSRGKT